LMIAKINDPKASTEERLRGINAAKEAKNDAARTELMTLIKSPAASAQLKTEAVRALTTFGSYDDAYAIVESWKTLPQMTRIAAAESLVRATKTARALLAGVEKKIVSPTDISATARRELAGSSDSTIADNADRLLGKYRKPGADKLKLIEEKKRVVLSGTADVNNGHEVAKRTCYVCHKLHGEGTDIGPDLTGVGRSTLDALLHNVIDPNEVIGNGYEATEVELKDGTTYVGRVVEETDTRIKLVNAGPVEYVAAKSDIAVANGKPKIAKKEMSLMPEGLEQLPDKDLRDLIMFILNPPQDQRPWTPALRKELLGVDEPKAAAAR
jgi:putative heme-binding domain-containing protein